jgi:two-component system cell cycle sensor histidine kinase/response regulator CckA
MNRAPATEPLARLMRVVLPYLLAGAAVSAGVLLRLLLARMVGAELPFITLFPVVFIVAYFLGFGPTVLATALGIMAAVELFMAPRPGVGVAEPVAQLGALLFGLTGIGIGWLGEARLRARVAAASALEHASSEAMRAEEETIRAEEEAARAEEETLRAEEEAQRSARESERIERVLASIGDAFLVVDHRWMVTYVNAAAAAMAGGRPDDLVGRLFWEAFPGSADGPLGELYRRAMGGGRVTREQAYSAPLGRWLQVTAYPSAEGLSIVAQDVSHRVRAQEVTERLAAIVASSVDGIIGKQLDGTIVSWNRGAEEIFGYSAEEIVGRPIYTLVPPELHDSEREILGRVRRGEPVASFETDRIRKDGQRITISLSVSPIRDESGRVVGVSSIKRDITSERRTRALLAAETARSRELTQVVDLAQALVRDLSGRISYWSTGAMRLYGWSASEAVGRVAHELLHTEFPTPLPEINRLLVEHGQWEGQLVHVARDGRRLHVASQWVLRRDADGRPEGVFEVNTDETSRRQMEERTRQSERLEVVGQLAGGVAHEANNQMTVVLGAADFLLRRPDLAGVARQDVEQIRAAAERTAAITSQLLAFSRRQVLRPRVLDLDETVRGLDLVLRRTLGEQSSLELRLGSAPGLVKADPGQLAQVLLNLVLNSRDAMPVGGRLTIETFCTELTEGYARQHPGVTIEPGPYVVLVVSDTGHGMSRETAARVFEPFYTTKPIGKGTGLGLATVYGIVKQSEGYVWTYSELGKGTTFKIYLPLAAEARPQGQSPPPAPRASGEVVLLVEDEPVVRQMASRVLQEYGYGVIEARDGREALGVLERGDGRIRLLVTDVVMPGMDGRELARLAEAVRPGLPVLYMSGYTDDEIVRRGLLEAGQPFLQKPFNPETLGGQVARMLQGRRT